MSFQRMLVLATCLLFSPIALAEAPEVAPLPPEPAMDEPGFDARIIHLKHADAVEVSRLIGSTMGCQAGVDRRTNSVVITGPMLKVVSAAKFLEQLDQPVPDDSIRSALIRVGESGSVMELLETRITHRTQAAFDPETGILALRGPEDEIQSAHEFIDQFEMQQRLRRETEAVRVSFFFLRGSLEPEEADEDALPMPPALGPALEVLAENGFYNASLIVPLMVRAQSGEPFKVAGRIEFDEQPIRMRVEGWLEVEAEAGVVRLHVASHVTRGTRENAGERMGKNEGVPLFDFESELTARIGDIIVLAASPIAGEGDMVALVVRLAPTQ